MTTSRNSLPEGYKLHWYVIRDILGQGGFGITYLAEDTNLNHLVAIKEFLPIEMAVRAGDASVHPVSGEQGENFHWGLERFISEAQTLARFRHNNIVSVFTVFAENNTAYMVMEYEKGQALDTILKSKARLAEQEVLNIVLPILDGLEHVHEAGFIHRDIKPPNIFIREDGSPVLLDFGSARQSLGEHTRTLTTMVSPGYAPFEQYVSKSDKQGPWTDIYGLGATMYRAVTGKSPPNAVDRSEAILHTGKDIYVAASEICRDEYSRPFLRAIDHSMAFKVDDRPHDVTAWRAEMSDASDMEDDDDETVLLPQPHEPGITSAAINQAATSAAAANDTGAVTAGPKSTRATPVQTARPKRIPRTMFWALVIIVITIVLVILPAKRRQNTVPQTTPVEAETNQPQPDISKTTANIKPANQTTPNQMDASPQENTVAAQPDRSEPTLQPFAKQPSELISSADRERLALLKNRLRENPNDKRAERQLLRMMDGYEKQVREALRQGDLASAEEYISELSELAPNNRKLQQALERIKQARARHQ